MANEAHLARLKKGVVAWNTWRYKNRKIRPDLSEANLSGARLGGAYLGRAILIKADLSGVYLPLANIGEADLSEANLTRAAIGWTIFGSIDLSTARGLETVKHRGPSTIGIDTLYRSQGNIPEVFLRGAGVPDEMITYIHIPSDLVVDRGASTVRGACPVIFRVHPLPSYATCQKINSTISTA